MLDFGIGLWTQTLDLGLDLDCDNISKHCIGHRTEYEEKCELTQSGYVTDEKCSKWPREVCTISKELRSKANPVTKCEKVNYPYL